MLDKQSWSVLLAVVGLTTIGSRSTVVAADWEIPAFGFERGIVLLIAGEDCDAMRIVDWPAAHESTLYVQTFDHNQPDAIRQAADRAGLLGKRIFADFSNDGTIGLADNIADAAVITSEAETSIADAEILRVLRPHATAHFANRQLVKPLPDGIDHWSHPYHGPDNNPQSQDQLVRGNLRTQFLGFPLFSPMPEQSVIAGGRIFKAMGHIAHKANQNQWLNTLVCINAYNGTLLWKRPLPAGFMIHRNTMIATDDSLLMGDHESCKVIDAESGEVRDQFTVPAAITDGPVWKWMALQDNVLYALVGNPEIQVDSEQSERRGLGHWPWGMWKGHDYSDPRTAFGFGRTVVAIDLTTKELLWHHRDKEFLDARGVCMNRDHIFCFSPERFLLCLNRRDGKLLWKNSDKDLLTAIAPNGRAQHYVTGYATTCYVKCNDDAVFFAGPQRNHLVAASARDGKLMWTQSPGNLQLVLRDEALFAAGPQGTTGVKIDYRTGKVLEHFPARRACTRATGCADSIFFRASGGTVRVFTETNTAHHIAPMRPPCQDGVIVSNGHLYWGPWMCGCQLSLYGNICLAPSPPPPTDPQSVFKDAVLKSDGFERVSGLPVHPNDWPTYRGDNARSDIAKAPIPKSVRKAWTVDVCHDALPTGPVAAGGMVFVADRTGAVQAFDPRGKQIWKAYTGGPIYYSPAIALDRVFVGSADGRVHALEAQTGRALWSFRVGPNDERIPVYGSLISRWPVAGGVLVDKETVYAAAGIAHYDGTYVVALDATSGRLIASNTTSGTIADDVNNGVSLQGELSIADGELRFLAGGVYETARYDLQSLRCLNEPKVQMSSEFRTAFYPYFPDYAKYVSLEHTCADGCMLTHDASYEGSLFTNLALEEPLPPGIERPRKEAARWLQRRGLPIPKRIWQDSNDLRFTSFVVSEDRLVAAGHPDRDPNNAFVMALKIKTGEQIWRNKLPSVVVKGGVAVDSNGRVYAVMENGRMTCFEPTLSN